MCKPSVHLLSCFLLLSVVGMVRGDLVGHWKFDEGTGAAADDSSGNGHHGKILGTPQWAAGPGGAGSALAFNPATCLGVDCGIFDPTNGTGKFSLALWAFWDGTGTYQHFFTKSNGWGTTTMMFQIELWGAHTVSTYTDRVGISYDPDSVPFSIMPKNEWAHLAWTFDGTNARQYLNGVDESGPKPLTIGPNVNATVFLGVDYNGGRVFHGSFDDVRLYSHALTADEVAALCPPLRTAKDPDPADGAMSVVNPLLRWKAGYNAMLHEVYLGTSPDLGPANLVQPRTPALFYYHIPGFEPGATFFWRVDEIEADQQTVNVGNVWSFTAQALTAYHPDPPDGTTNAATAPTLTWLPGQSAIKHHLYFGDSFEAVSQGAAAADKGELIETSFVPGDLQSTAAYFWRVDESAALAGVRTGPVWSFTTCLPVDDFESYNDEENKGTRIYETWIDGWTNNNGSMVGHTDPPFAEQAIMHGGLQSMPLDYNNVNPPFYSEAEREFAIAEDWTVNDVNTLVLYVRGRADNSPAQLYVAVEDTSRHKGTVTCAEAAAVIGTKWVEWKIPFADFTAAGVNMARVKKLYIGLGDRADPKPGGRGLIYIDDIRAIK